MLNTNMARMVRTGAFSRHVDFCTRLSENSPRLATGFHFWEKTNYQDVKLKDTEWSEETVSGLIAKLTIATCRKSPEERRPERRPLCCLQKVPLLKNFKEFQKSVVSVM